VSPMPRQYRLPLIPSRTDASRCSPITSQDRLAERNHICAEIILADVARYGGEEALPVIWARKIVAQCPAHNERGLDLFADARDIKTPPVCSQCGGPSHRNVNMVSAPICGFCEAHPNTTLTYSCQDGVFRKIHAKGDA
jgi:hypothetical protein